MARADGGAAGRVLAKLHVPACDLARRRATEQRERKLHLVAEELEHARGAGGSVDSQPPQHCATCEDGLRPERQRLDHVDSSAYTSVDEHRHAPAYRVDDLRQRIDRGWDAVELSPAVVR